MLGKHIYNFIIVTLCVIYVIYPIYKYKKVPKNKKEYLKKIELLYIKKKWDKAINLSIDALNKFQLCIEDKVTVTLTIANSHYELQQYKDAVNYYNEAFELTFSSHKKYYYSECFICALDSLIKLNRNEDAKNLFHKIICCSENKKDFKKLIKFAEKNEISK